MIGQHKVLIHPARGNMLLIYDIVKNHIEGKELAVNNDMVPYLKEIIEQRFCQSGSVVNEMDNFGVRLLDLAINQKQKNKNSVKTEPVGEKIYRTLVKQ